MFVESRPEQLSLEFEKEKIVVDIIEPNRRTQNRERKSDFFA